MRSYKICNVLIFNICHVNNNECTRTWRHLVGSTHLQITIILTHGSINWLGTSDFFKVLMFDVFPTINIPTLKLSKKQQVTSKSYKYMELIFSGIISWMIIIQHIVCVDTCIYHRCKINYILIIKKSDTEIYSFWLDHYLHYIILTPLIPWPRLAYSGRNACSSHVRLFRFIT